MKRNLILCMTGLVFSGFFTPTYAQYIKKLEDKSIVAQEKRQVFQQWGDWRPKPKYFLGIQTNWAYTMAWGWLAPSRNRDYKGGSDIRPIGPAGRQNQRYVSTKAQESETQKTHDHVEQVYDQAKAEYLHYTGITAPADPLYLLYYKEMLKELDEFETGSTYYKDWGLSSSEAYQECIQYGTLTEIKRRIEETQEKYDMARTIDIARGKRLMMYHECLLQWRKCKSYLEYLSHKAKISLETKEKLKKTKNTPVPDRHQKDAEIYRDILLRIQ